MKIPNLYYFQHHEFDRGGEWYSSMSPRLLVMLDLFRFRWKKPIKISNSNGSLGRHLGDSFSQHNFDRWEEVRAADIIPSGIETRDDLYLAYKIAADIGFTGIGLYDYWNQGPGLHVDVRQDRLPGFPITWGRTIQNDIIVNVSANDILETFV